VSTKFHYTRQLKPEKFTHHTTLEVIWTIIPTFIVLAIAVPSLTLIYSLVRVRGIRLYTPLKNNIYFITVPSLTLIYSLLRVRGIHQHNP